MDNKAPRSTKGHNGKKNTMNEISFTVTVEETNLILEGLGHMPFAKVFALVAKIQEQAQHQLNGENRLGEEADTKNPAPAIEEQADAE